MKNGIYFLLIMIFMVSCYPEQANLYENFDLVYTNYEEEFDFSSQRTYVMPDKIVKITGNLEDGEEPKFIKEPYNSQVLSQIESNMTAKGWTKIEDPKNADIAILPAVWTNTTVTYYYDYWCWYDSYYCDWGYYYPYGTSYTTGTLVMSMVTYGDSLIDPYIVWTGLANGLLSGYYDVDRVTQAVDQAFEQSPYLNIK
jgi:hypothetical protein